jgi:hypothetical protein
MMKDEKDHGGTSLTEGASVSVAVPTPELSHAGQRASDRLLREIPEQVHQARANGIQREVTDRVRRFEPDMSDMQINAVIVESLNYFARSIFSTIGTDRFKDCTPDDVLRFVGVCAKRTTMRIGSGTVTDAKPSDTTRRSEAPSSNSHSSEASR